MGETRATRWTLRPPRCGDVQPSLAGAAVSGASGGIGSRHSDTRHQTPPGRPSTETHEDLCFKEVGGRKTVVKPVSDGWERNQGAIGGGYKTLAIGGGRIRLECD